MDLKDITKIETKDNNGYVSVGPVDIWHGGFNDWIASKEDAILLAEIIKKAIDLAYSVEPTDPLAALDYFMPSNL